MSNYQVAVYYFPNYHADRRNEEWHGKGWTEWELVKAAKPRFDGHQQPKVPLWGYEDESKPEAMQRKIDAAADHGVSAFIFDSDRTRTARFFKMLWRRVSLVRPTTGG